MKRESVHFYWIVCWARSEQPTPSHTVAYAVDNLKNSYFQIVLRVYSNFSQPQKSQCKGKWVDNIRMDLQKVGCGYVDWIGMAHDRDRWQTLVSAVMDIRVP